MRLHQRLALVYVLVVVLALASLIGCRAFEPETVIVNHPPETYLTGAPTEEGGGQFHFHLFWYGTDSDGRVERFVWALTDSTIQDDESDDDQEDERFNPAVNITTLDIAHWTTATDTVIDFQIGGGALTSRDMTFHIVAIDDRGDFDRTPARLYFLSNALGVPDINFYNSTEQVAANLIADSDTIGFAEPLTITWKGETPNIRSFSQFHLEQRDTVPPLDGLQGYKYRLPLDVACDEVNEDCWFPQVFDINENGNVSIYGDVNELNFANDGSGQDAFNRYLFQGVHLLLVNTIDVAGVEVPGEEQELNFIVNYDPDTMILGLPKDFDGPGGDDPVMINTDPFYPSDTTVYPYYKVYRPDGTEASASFAPADTVPHRSVAVFKAVGWDDADDQRLADLGLPLVTDYQLALQSKFEAWGRFRGGDSFFRFETQFSEAVQGVWDDPTAGASSDTMSVLVGPFRYEFSMRAVDEHERRDGTAEIFPFFGNRPPEMQCLEIVLPDTPSGFPDLSCSADIDTFYVSISGDASATHPDWTRLPQESFTPIDVWVNPTSNSIVYGPKPLTSGFNTSAIKCYPYQYDILAYAEDHELDRLFMPRNAPGGQTFGDPADRTFSYRYEIVSHIDSIGNVILDGSGVDNLLQVSYSFTENDADFRDSFDDNGVWRLPVQVLAPQLMLTGGPFVLRGWMEATNAAQGWGDKEIDRAIEMVAGQMGLSTATFMARDGSNPDIREDRCSYYYYDGVRAPLEHGESCQGTPDYENLVDGLEYQFFTFESAPMQRQYVLKLLTNTGEIFPPMP
jgi:hypothetical protein